MPFFARSAAREKWYWKNETPSSTAPFHWHCDACGHQWADDGIEE